MLGGNTFQLGVSDRVLHKYREVRYACVLRAGFNIIVYGIRCFLNMIPQRA